MSDRSEQVLVWAPRGRDASLAVHLMERHGFEARVISSIDVRVTWIPDRGCALISA
jgi:hypothetical protein